MVSYCRSVIAPYLVTVGHGAMVGLYDVRQRDPAICQLSAHQSDICNLSWSVNHSSDLMRQSSPDQVRLATASIDGTLAIWSLHEIFRSKRDQVVTQDQTLFMSTISDDSPVQAMAWHPKKDGLFATGCSSPD